MYFQLDEDTVVYPVNIQVEETGVREHRALINYREAREKEANSASSKGPMIFVNWMKSILTKAPAENLGPEENIEEYGNDPVDLVDDWVTLVEDGYLNLRFRTMWGYGGKTHKVNLVYTPTEDNPYCVTFYHDAMGDTSDYQSDGIVAFSLDSLPDTNGQTVDLLVKWESFQGPKQEIFEYRSR